MNRCDNLLYSTWYDIGYYIKTFGEKFVVFNLYGFPRIQCMVEFFRLKLQHKECEIWIKCKLFFCYTCKVAKVHSSERHSAGYKLMFEHSFERLPFFTRKNSFINYKTTLLNITSKWMGLRIICADYG